MVDFLSKGGVLLAPIFLGSLIGLAIFFERSWSLRRKCVLPIDVARQLQMLIQRGQLAEARVLCQKEESSLARVMRTILSQVENQPSQLELREISEEAGQREAFFLERGIGALGIVASLEPLMGLLGTVLGMIRAFQKVEIGGVGDPRLVAGGVWVALITTAAGLSVAIPAYVGYRFLLSKVDRLVLDLQNEVSMLIRLLSEQLQKMAREEIGLASPTVLEGYRREHSKGEMVSIEGK